MSIVQAVKLQKVYGNGKVALRSLSLEVQPGEVFGFLGPNGAGKTTAVKIFMGFVAPTFGLAQVFGLPPGSPAAKARLGFLPEHFRFYEWLTGRELLNFYGRLAGLDAGRRKKRIQETIQLVGLEEAVDFKVRGYSKGMQQRIGLAQALLHEPELVFLDEPTSALDPLGRREVRDVIRRLKSEGVTVFLNSHLLSEVELVCDNVAIVDHGAVVRSGPLSELLARDQQFRVVVDRVSDELSARLSQLGPIEEATPTELLLKVSSVETAAQVAEIVHELGLKLYALVPAQRSLEDIFVQAVEGEDR
jgi:ABC-2 type transport system ATP-binding protein